MLLIHQQQLSCSMFLKLLNWIQVQHEAAHQDTPVGADDGQGEGRVPAQVGQDA